MLISLDWIKDFIELPHDLTEDEFVDRITLGVAEVEGSSATGRAFSEIFVSQIKSIRKHPEADKLNLVTVCLPNGDLKEVVCGAHNVKENLKIVYAPVGVTLPIGLTLTPKKIRGVLSEGMICSEEELGLADKSEGILELPEDAPVGESFLDFTKKKVDVVLDIDNKSLTHRPDLWGHIGFARECAALFDRPLSLPFNLEWKKSLQAKFSNDTSPIIPVVEENSSCLCYYGLSVDNVQVQESPEWLKDRLIAVGLRPINNIVDISNYVMLEMGQPLHIFDRDLIKDNTIKIHKLEDSVKFETLDEVERDLVAGDTVISDSEKPLVLAGIMGGHNSGVNQETKRIFIEVANWKASEVRGTSTRLGLRTDSSQRFEKTLDSSLAPTVVLRTLEMILAQCPEAKVVGKMESSGKELDLPAYPLEIRTSVQNISSLLGKEISKREIIRILSALEYQVTEEGEGLLVKVPSFRATKDIEFEADIIEEIGRIIGYDNIEPSSPKLTVAPVSLSEFQKLQRKLRDYLVFNRNSFEVLTYPLIGPELIKKSEWIEENKDLVLVNALSDEQDRMRPSLIPSLLEAISRNQKSYSDFNLFELGRTYHSGKKQFAEEKTVVGFVSYSKDENCFLRTKFALEGMLGNLNIPFDCVPENPKFDNPLIPRNWGGRHPKEFINIRVMGKMAGGVSTIHPLILKNFKVKGNVTIGLIDLSPFEKIKLKDKLKFVPISKFPSAKFDCTVTTDLSTPLGEILAPVRKIKDKEFSSVKIVDIFKLDEKNKAVTLRSEFSDAEKTLPGEVIKSLEDRVVKVLHDSGFPLKN